MGGYEWFEQTVRLHFLSLGDYHHQRGSTMSERRGRLSRCHSEFRQSDQRHLRDRVSISTFRDEHDGEYRVAILNRQSPGRRADGQQRGDVRFGRRADSIHGNDQLHREWFGADCSSGDRPSAESRVQRHGRWNVAGDNHEFGAGDVVVYECCVGLADDYDSSSGAPSTCSARTNSGNLPSRCSGFLIYLNSTPLLHQSTGAWPCRSPTLRLRAR